MPNPRKLLFPLSLIYHGITEVRNILYDIELLKSESFDVPVIAVGNLNMGGTGKSPMIEYLLKLLSEKYKIATLSRGYKREGKGFHLVDINDPVSMSGDEPLQFKNKYPDTLVAVDANRRRGISELLKSTPDVILLDDAFQHRKVQAGLYILLTAYGDLYKDDLILPAGNLRESSRGAKRADIIVVTKCPGSLSNDEMELLRLKLQPGSHQKVLFTTIKYAEEIISKGKRIAVRDIDPVDFVLVTGIENPTPLVQYLSKKEIKLKHLKYPDHHNFSEKEIAMLGTEKAILTTEKDYMRLRDRLPEYKLYYLPIEAAFLDNGAELFRREVETFINKNEV